MHSNFFLQRPHNTNSNPPMTNFSNNLNNTAMPSKKQPAAALSVPEGKITDYWKSRSKYSKKLLAPSFMPSDYTVICGRSKQCFDSTGNRRFRVTVKVYLQEYSEATGKTAKSKIVTKIYNLIREASPEGAFVTNASGRWYECSERIAREKIGARFRDLLHEDYKSSAKAKQAKKNYLEGQLGRHRGATPTSTIESQKQEHWLSVTQLVTSPIAIFPFFFDVDGSDGNTSPVLLNNPL